MPELPEVEVVKNGLAPHITNRIITAVRSSGKQLRNPVPDADMRNTLPGCTIISLKRRAKYLILGFNTGALLVIHLGMTGKLGLFPHKSNRLRHDHVALLLDNGMELRLNDVRRFGSIHLVPPEKADTLEQTVIKNTGPEPFDPAFNVDYLLKKAAGKTKPVKNFIMDNNVVAGIGNIYANESLFAAGIKPASPTGSISRKKWNTFITETRKVLEWAIECGGSTISDFLDASGQPGYFQINFKVYGKKDQPCTVCSTPIERTVIGGRASYYCCRCQR